MTRKELKDIIFECYVNHLREQDRLLKEDQDKESNMVFKEANSDVLPDSTDQILVKFPTLKHALVRLQTEEFPEFVASIDWISPKPTAFRINLKNGQSFTLTWQGKDFKAEISGKEYYLGELINFQRAIKKLSDLYQEGPMGQEEEPTGGEMGAEPGGPAMSGGGSGDFPGGPEGGEMPEETGGEENAEGGEEGSSEEGKDLGDADIDFESDENI